MLERKINAGLSLLTTWLLLDHAIFNAVRMFSHDRITGSAGFLAWILMGLMVLHAFISIDLGVSAHMEGEKRKVKSYPKLNRPTILQRMTGVLLLPLTALHVAGTLGVMTPPPVVHAILPLVFFAVALLHASISTGKALITLGIGSAKFVKTADIAIKVFCAVVWLADVVSFTLYY